MKKGRNSRRIHESTDFRENIVNHKAALKGKAARYRTAPHKTDQLSITDRNTSHIPSV